MIERKGFGFVSLNLWLEIFKGIVSENNYQECIEKYYRILVFFDSPASQRLFFV